MRAREHFDQQLKEISQEVLFLGSMVEKAIERAVDSLERHDLKEAAKVVEDDKLINKKRFEIENRCAQLIATQQPVAADLRFLIAVLHIVVDLERTGDYAMGIARINLMLGKEPPIKPLTYIFKMAQKAKEMLHRSLLCLVNRDINGIFQICEDEDEVDRLRDMVYNELPPLMCQGIQDVQNICGGIYLTWIAHNLERIADRATNIAERVYFWLTGKLVEGLKG